MTVSYKYCLHLIKVNPVNIVQPNKKQRSKSSKPKMKTTTKKKNQEEYFTIDMKEFLTPTSSLSKSRGGQSIQGNIHSSISAATEKIARSNSPDKSLILEASFRHGNLTAESSVAGIHTLVNLKALDLSYNKINSCPRGLPSKLIALDLSFNLFSSINGFKMMNLIELKLKSNRIKRYNDKANSILFYICDYTVSISVDNIYNIGINNTYIIYWYR